MGIPKHNMFKHPVKISVDERNIKIVKNYLLFRVLNELCTPYSKLRALSQQVIYPHRLFIVSIIVSLFLVY